MMREMIQATKTNPSIEKIELRVLSTNTRAIAVYKKLGFQEAGRSKNGFKFGPNDYRDDIFMELFLY
jgi:RimJ/RimL family protein N-acetyltransferase